MIEVKSGKKAPRALNRDTRRQLLEYALHFQVEDIFLYDAEEKKLQKISFPRLQITETGGLKTFIVGLCWGVLLCCLIFALVDFIA